MDKYNFKKLGRVAIFIDAANVLYSHKTLGWELDYKKIFIFFNKQTKLVKAFFYSAYRTEKKSQQHFLAKMEGFGYLVKSKKIKIIKNKKGVLIKIKGSLDVELALDMIVLAPKYDTAILLSGDSDFEPAIKLLRQKGKQVIVFSSRGHIAKELIRAANKYFPFENFKVVFKRDQS